MCMSSAKINSDGYILHGLIEALSQGPLKILGGLLMLPFAASVLPAFCSIFAPQDERIRTSPWQVIAAQIWLRTISFIVWLAPSSESKLQLHSMEVPRVSGSRVPVLPSAESGQRLRCLRARAGYSPSSVLFPGLLLHISRIGPHLSLAMSGWCCGCGMLWQLARPWRGSSPAFSACLWGLQRPTTPSCC